MELSSILPSPHSDLLTALAYSPSSSHLLLASADSTLALFRRSPATGLFAADDRWKAHDGPVGGVAWAGEEWGVVCASWGWDRRICVWREDVDGPSLPLPFPPRASLASHPLARWSSD